MQLRRSGTNIALNGDFTFCALNDSNDLDVVKRPQRTTSARVGSGMRFQSHLTHQFLEESKRPLTIQTNGFSSRSSRPSRISAIPDTLHSLLESLTDRFMLQMGQVLRFRRKQPTSPKRVFVETMVHKTRRAERCCIGDAESDGECLVGRGPRKGASDVLG
jgi:hypothetical protein